MINYRRWGRPGKRLADVWSLVAANVATHVSNVRGSKVVHWSPWRQQSFDQQAGGCVAQPGVMATQRGGSL